MGVAGLTENKANSANPAELRLGLSWVELGKRSTRGRGGAFLRHNDESIVRQL